MTLTKTMDLSEAMAAARAGGILSITLRAQGAAFFIELETRQAGFATLVTSNGRKPRAFRKPEKAFTIARDLEIDAGRFILSDWRPGDAEFERASRPDRTQFLKETFATAHDAWFRDEVLKSLRDNTARVLHATAIACMDIRASRPFSVEAGIPQQLESERTKPRKLKSGQDILWTGMAALDAWFLGRPVAPDRSEGDLRPEVFDQQIGKLKHQTDLGEPGRVSGTYELLIAGTPYVAVYMPYTTLEEGVADCILVIRILHVSRQQPKWLISQLTATEGNARNKNEQ